MKYHLLPLLTLPLMAACGDDAKDAYVEPVVVDPTVFTPLFAESIWEQYLPSEGFVDSEETIPTDELDPDFEEFAENWLGEEESRDVVITFDGENANVEFLDDSKKTKEAVKITKEGAHVVIRNERLTDGQADGRARMNYILRGSTDNGSVRIYSNKKFMVSLDNVSLTNAVGAAINVQKSFEKKRMFLNLPEGTVNHLCDATLYSDTIEGEDEKGALFSEGKLIICGKGELHVTGQRSHAIAADDRIRIHAGVTLAIDSAAKDGIHCNDAVILSGGRISIYAEKDAIQSNTDPNELNKGITLGGGLIYTCSNRAFNAKPEGTEYANWHLNGAKICAIYRDNLLPCYWQGAYSIKTENDYSILYNE